MAVIKPVATAMAAIGHKIAPSIGAVAAIFLLLGGVEAQAGSAEAFPVQLAATAAEAGYAEKGAEACIRCHDKAPVTHILKTPHGMAADQRTPFAEQACETCHGASPEHMEKPADGEERAPVAISFGKTGSDVETQNGVCQTCHTGGKQAEWLGSEHQYANVTCVSCHDVHTTDDPARNREAQPTVCYECHAEQRAESRLLSHHPINEGLTACSDCHEPHGSTSPKLLAGATLNDTCYDCHAEKRGPFLWEHAPVREDCSTCHKPHGSTQPRLLTVRAPFLCQECHQENYHPSNLYDGADVATAAQQLVGKACLNCHSQVHGSNHPSGVRALR